MSWGYERAIESLKKRLTRQAAKEIRDANERAEGWSVECRKAWAALAREDKRFNDLKDHIRYAAAKVDVTEVRKQWPGPVRSVVDGKVYNTPDEFLQAILLDKGLHRIGGKRDWWAERGYGVLK